MDLLDRITHDPEKYGGKACIRGMRMPVHVILSNLAGGMTHKEILDDFPFLEEDDISAALAYAAKLVDKTEAAA